MADQVAWFDWRANAGLASHCTTSPRVLASPRRSRERPKLWHFVALAWLPAVLGVWIGGFIYSNLAATVFLALGAGAIAQVVYEVGRLIMRQSREDGTPVLSRATFGGLIAGVAIMYATALLVAG